MSHTVPHVNIPIIIPAYEPDKRLITFLKSLRKNAIAPIILVNDGSSSNCERIFKEAETLSDIVLVHKKNCGKGMALKTAFRYVLEHYPKCIGVITADADGQHSVECILKVMNKMKANQNSFVMGVRNFDIKNVPWRSRLGNKLTRALLHYITGTKVKDTQTGLRGIPYSFLPTCLNLSGERFEFEIQVLLEAAEKLPIVEVTIKTIYDSVQNHQTHFNPVVDSIKIYKHLCYPFFKYIFSSLSSFAVDILLFSVFLWFLSSKCNESIDIILSTILARIVSVIYNYIINYKIVFKSGCSISKSAIRYLELATAQMLLSAFCTTALNILLPNAIIVGLKIFVDTILFLISYFIQKKYVFSIKYSK